MELSPFAGYSFFEKRQNLEHSPVFGGRLGYNITSSLGIEGMGEFTPSEVDDRTTSFTRQDLANLATPFVKQRGR